MVNKIAFVHIPKCGTTFIFTLFIYVNKTIPYQNFYNDNLLSADNGIIKNFITKNIPKEKYFKNIDFWPYYPPIDHTPLSSKVYNHYKGNLFGFFRNPKDRIISAYSYFNIDNQNLKYKYITKLLNSKKNFKSESSYINKYIEDTKGSITKQLAGQAYGTSCLADTIKSGRCIHIKPNLSIALNRLDHFAFIGITEQYNLSLCLFSVMFNTKLSKYSFNIVRKTKINNNEKNKIVKEFKNFRDYDDEMVYNYSFNIFKKNLNKYNMTKEKCLKILNKI